MDSFLAAAYGVWLHSKAGKELGPGLIAEDIPNILPTLFKNLYNN